MISTWIMSLKFQLLYKIQINQFVAPALMTYITGKSQREHSGLLYCKQAQHKICQIYEIRKDFREEQTDPRDFTVLD